MDETPLREDAIFELLRRMIEGSHWVKFYKRGDSHVVVRWRMDGLDSGEVFRDSEVSAPTAWAAMEKAAKRWGSG